MGKVNPPRITWMVSIPAVCRPSRSDSTAYSLLFFKMYFLHVNPFPPQNTHIRPRMTGSETGSKNICKREQNASHASQHLLEQKLLSEQLWLIVAATVGVWKCAQACVRSAMFTRTWVCVWSGAEQKRTLITRGWRLEEREASFHLPLCLPRPWWGPHAWARPGIPFVWLILKV